MHLIQILLPLYNNDKESLPVNLFHQTRDELIDQFGGLTSYVRAPATGLWQENDGHTVQDQIVIYEIMTDVLDVHWWENYRKMLSVRFQQQTVVVRAMTTRIL